jgi:hypothetical protein
MRLVIIVPPRSCVYRIVELLGIHGTHMTVHVSLILTGSVAWLEARLFQGASIELNASPDVRATALPGFALRIPDGEKFTRRDNL